MVLPHMVVYRCLWAVGARSAQRRMLIGSWATLPITGAIEIERGCEYYVSYADFTLVLPSFIYLNIALGK